MITHIVLIKWNSTATAADHSSVDAMIISMKDLCQTGEGEPYITDIISGPQNNTEGLSDAHYGFVATFANATDRDYYVNEDLFHNRVKEKLGPLVEKVEVFDIEH